MANDDADHTGPRVGGWVPVYRNQRPDAQPLGEDDAADRLYATPSTDTGSFRHGAGEKGRSRAVLIVAAIVAMVLLSAGGITYALHNQGSAQTIGGAAPWSPVPASDPTGFTDTQQNPGLTVSQSPSAAISGPPSSAVPSEVSTSALPSAGETTRAPTKKPTPGKSTTTTTPVTASSLTPGLPVSLEPVSLPGTRVRHYGGEAFVQKIDTSSATARGDSRWIVHNGRGDSTCISLESANFPGEYLRRLDGRIRKDAPDGSAQFDVEATFCAEKVNDSAGRVQLRTPDTFQYIKRQGDILFLGEGGVAGETFLVKTPF